MSGARRPLLILAAAVAAAVARSWLVPAVAGGPAGTKICQLECLEYSKRLPLKILKSYKIITCEGKASVILETKGNRNMCARREENWVKDAMKAIDAWKTVTKDPPGAGKHAGEAVVMSQDEDQAQLANTFSPTPYRMATVPSRTAGDPNSSAGREPAGSEGATSSTSSALHPEDEPTLQSETIANREVISKTPEGENFTTIRKVPGDFPGTAAGLLPPPATLTSPDEPRTKVNGFVSETLTGPSTPRPASSTFSKHLLSSFHADHRSTSAKSFTVLPHPKDTDTPSGSEGSNASSANLKNSSDARNKGGLTDTPFSMETSTFSKTLDTTSISGFKESMSGTVANTSKVPSKLQDHTVPQIMIPLCGFLSIALAVGGLAYAKGVICTRPSAKRVIQGLVYSPCESRREAFPLEKL